ncbi:hypothetical protein evm_010098 [Chilo suppressalis]|nr:hypothetical protein evm_010098 [Chilo suppressalis]
MRLVKHTFILLYGIVLCDGGYSGGQDAQSDVQAPSYVPAYLKNQKYPKTSYGTNNNYSGTKTGYSGTKNPYSGTKTGYAGTKTGYSGTKNRYTYTGTSKSPYGERRSWDTGTGQGPSYHDFQNSANHAMDALFRPKCVPECKNSGICVATNTCQCPSNYRGQYCEFEKKPCFLNPPLPKNSKQSCSSEFCTIQCLAGHKFIDGTTVANLKCSEGQWKPTRADLDIIPDCQPECEPRCQNGGVCLALNTCMCPDEYRGPHCQYPTSVCDVRKLGFNGGYSCFGDADKFSCKLNCPSGSTYSAPRANLYSCRYDTGIFEPQPIPHCVFSDAYMVAPTVYHNNSTSYYESHSWHSSSDIHAGGSQSGSSWTSTGDTHAQAGYGAHAHGGGTHMVVRDLTPKGGVCLTWAGVHYKTFDGKIYG